MCACVRVRVCVCVCVLLCGRSKINSCFVFMFTGLSPPKTRDGACVRPTGAQFIVTEAKEVVGTLCIYRCVCCYDATCCAESCDFFCNSGGTRAEEWDDEEEEEDSTEEDDSDVEVLSVRGMLMYCVIS